MRRIGIIVGYIGVVIVFGGLLVGGIRFAQQQSASNIQPPVAVERDPGKDTSNSTAPEPDSSTMSQEPPQSTSTSELPQTGMADSFLSVLGLGMLTAFVAAYIRSRRLVLTL